MKTVKYFDTPFEAHAARGLLENEGMQAVVHNENIGSAIPITLANPAMRPYVAVSDEDYGRAAELLCDNVPGAAAECPGCGSADIKYGIDRDGRKRAIKLMFVILSLFGGGMVGNIRSIRYCGRCSKEF